MGLDPGLWLSPGTLWCELLDDDGDPDVLSCPTPRDEGVANGLDGDWGDGETRPPLESRLALLLFCS
jgi:hypothetical protein